MDKLELIEKLTLTVHIPALRSSTVEKFSCKYISSLDTRR